MTRKLYTQILLMLAIGYINNSISANLTEDFFSDIRAPKNSSYQIHMEACERRIAEEMCNGRSNIAPTPEAILNFIEKIQIYINKIKDTQDICHKTVNVAHIAVLDVAKARKLLTKATHADILTDIRHAIHKVDKQVIELEEYLKKQS